MPKKPRVSFDFQLFKDCYTQFFRNEKRRDRIVSTAAFQIEATQKKPFLSCMSSPWLPNFEITIPLSDSVSYRWQRFSDRTEREGLFSRVIHRARIGEGVHMKVINDVFLDGVQREREEIHSTQLHPDLLHHQFSPISRKINPTKMLGISHLPEQWLSAHPNFAKVLAAQKNTLPPSQFGRFRSHSKRQKFNSVLPYNG